MTHLPRFLLTLLLSAIALVTACSAGSGGQIFQDATLMCDAVANDAGTIPRPCDLPACQRESRSSTRRGQAEGLEYLFVRCVDPNAIGAGATPMLILHLEVHYHGVTYASRRFESYTGSHHNFRDSTVAVTTDGYRIFWRADFDEGGQGLEDGCVLHVEDPSGNIVVPEIRTHEQWFQN